MFLEMFQPEQIQMEGHLAPCFSAASLLNHEKLLLVTFFFNREEEGIIQMQYIIYIFFDT